MTFLLTVYVQPGAKKTEISGKHNGLLKVRLKSSPIENKANEELIDFFSTLLNLKKKDILLLKGKKSRIKTLSIPIAIQDAKFWVE